MLLNSIILPMSFSIPNGSFILKITVAKILLIGFIVKQEHFYDYN